jgi:putative FmdB family regulatory protein
MALYEFQCNKCRKRFTVRQTFEEHDRKPKSKCPKCGSLQVRQLVSTVHVQTSKKS